MNTHKLPPLPHWCEPGSPFAEQMQAYALAAIKAQEESDAVKAAFHAGMVEGEKLAHGVPMQWPKPEDVTPEMLDAFKSAYKNGDFWKTRIHGALCAMLAAAPPAPQAMPEH